jgi:hypothetical protein
MGGTGGAEQGQDPDVEVTLDGRNHPPARTWGCRRAIGAVDDAML